MNFEVEIKYGNRWSYKAIYNARSSRSAAIRAAYVWNRKVIRVRPEGSCDKWIVYRFLYIPSLAAG